MEIPPEGTPSIIYNGELLLIVLSPRMITSASPPGVCVLTIVTPAALPCKRVMGLDEFSTESSEDFTVEIELVRDFFVWVE
jgi:hypothetical protein